MGTLFFMIPVNGKHESKFSHSLSTTHDVNKLLRALGSIPTEQLQQIFSKTCNPSHSMIELVPIIFYYEIAIAIAKWVQNPFL